MTAEQGFRNLALTLISPVVAVVQTLVYVGVFLTQFGRGVTGGLGVGAAAEPARLPDLPNKREGKREPAYPQYLFGQIWADTRQVARLSWRYQRKAFSDAIMKKSVGRFKPEHAADEPNIPFGIAFAVAIAVGFAGAAVLLAAVTAVQAVVFVSLAAVSISVIYLLRVIDSGLLLLRGIRITCPNPRDYGRVPYPAYRCDTCGTMHFDVRPGRYGVVKRVCRCGNKLPTLLMLGSHRLDAFCPKCEEPLPGGSGGEREIVLPVIGASNAGKTQLMVLLAQAVREKAERMAGTAEPGDDYTRDWIKEQSRRLAASGMPQKTGPELRPPYVLRLKLAKRRRTLKIFDVAGEVFDTAVRIDELRYVSAARTFVFVLDPLAIDAFWKSLDQPVRDKLGSVRSARDPESIFANAAHAFDAMQVQSKQARLFVAVSKADLISAELDRLGVDDDTSIQTWLCQELNQDNMVNAMRQHFASVQFMLTAAVRRDDEVDDSIRRFLDTALAAEGVA